MSLFDVGAKRRAATNSPRPTKRQRLQFGPGLHKCPDCNFVTTKPGPLATHRKKHKKAQTGQRSVVEGLDKRKMAERQKQRAEEIEIRFVLNDIIKKVERVNKQPKKKDGRCRNHQL